MLKWRLFVGIGYVVQNLMEPIYIFTPQDEPYGNLSIMANTGIYADGQYWRTVEHYYQAMKFITTDKAYVERIRTAPTAKHARKLGHNPNKPLRSDWDNVKDQIMHEAVMLKFQQHEHLGQLLLRTAPAPLIEHSTSSLYWGESVLHGHGENRLGQMLMMVRDELSDIIGNT